MCDSISSGFTVNAKLNYSTKLPINPQCIYRARDIRAGKQRSTLRPQHSGAARLFPVSTSLLVSISFYRKINFIRRSRDTPRPPFCCSAVPRSTLIYWCAILMDPVAPKRAVRARPRILLPVVAAFAGMTVPGFHLGRLAPHKQRHGRVSIHAGVTPPRKSSQRERRPTARHVRQTSAVFLKTWGKSSASQDMRVPFIFPRTRYYRLPIILR